MRRPNNIRHKINSYIIRRQSFSFIVPLVLLLVLLFTLAACGSSRPSQKIVEVLLKYGADAAAKSEQDFGGYVDEGDTARKF